MPAEISEALSKIDADKLYEIRIRLGFPVLLNVNGQKAYLTENGYSIFSEKAIICNEKTIKNIIDELTEHSIYAFNDRIRQGYLTTKEGVRVGLAGECVYDGNNLLTIKNITSLNLRIPHEIYGCADKFFGVVTDSGQIKNALLISPPFFGKTTILKDLSRKLNEKFNKSIMIIDERGEFESVKGINIDTVKYSDKLYALTFGLRSMSPEIIITDELIERRDWQCALTAINSGLKIIASCHAESAKDLLRKEYFIKNIFDRYVVLDNNNGFGKIREVFDGEFNKL